MSTQPEVYPHTASSAPIEISIAHSPDSDDAFMFYGLATNKVRVPGYKFTHTLSDIETLNRRAQEEAFFDVTAISFHAYPYLQQSYTLMGCGGSVGEGYGPMIVASRKLALEDLKHVRVAVPGTLTTAYLAMKIFNPEIATVTVPFDRIIPEILAGNYDAGLIIHEGQLTYSSSGLYKAIDLGVCGGRRRGWCCRWEGTRSGGRWERRRTRRSRRRSGTASGTRWTTASRRWSTRCSLRGTWIRGWRTGL